MPILRTWLFWPSLATMKGGRISKKEIRSARGFPISNQHVHDSASTSS